jgi:predicted lactoylglutathione lyase
LPLDKNKDTKPENGLHIAFSAKSQQMCKDFHKIALENGATDAGNNLNRVLNYYCMSSVEV